jgi:hypothetical protein
LETNVDDDILDAGSDLAGYFDSVADKHGVDYPGNTQGDVDSLSDL